MSSAAAMDFAGVEFTLSGQYKAMLEPRHSSENNRKLAILSYYCNLYIVVLRVLLWGGRIVVDITQPLDFNISLALCSIWPILKPITSSVVHQYVR